MGTSLTTGSSQTMPDNAAQVLHCANHPERETVLRCNRCEKPICYDCAVLTEVGYRCKECVRGQQAKYYNGEPLDPLIGVVFGLILGGLAGIAAFLFLGIFGFFFGFLIALFAGPAAGGIIAEVVRGGREAAANTLPEHLRHRRRPGRYVSGRLYGPRPAGGIRQPLAGTALRGRHGEHYLCTIALTLTIAFAMTFAIACGRS